jgi:hypothetical protein
VTEKERAARRLRLLQARLHQDLDAVAQVHGRVRLAAERVVDQGEDPVTVGAAALYLQNLYTAIEESLKRIASDLDGAVPAGKDWHRELLRQMALELPGTRPAVIDDELLGDLDRLRRFRHLVRHAYVAEYVWAEIVPVIAASERALGRFRSSIGDLNGWLDRTVESLHASE